MVAADSVVAVEVETAEDVVASEAAEEVSEVETAVVVEASEVEIVAVAVASEVDAEDSGESHYRSIFLYFLPISSTQLFTPFQRFSSRRRRSWTWRKRIFERRSRRPWRWRNERRQIRRGGASSL